MDNRQTRSDIAEMQGRVSIPRKSGEMVFHHEWEKRAFAMAVALAEDGKYEWKEFQQALIEAIAAAESDDPQQPERGYFESWLISLEKMIQDKALLS